MYCIYIYIYYIYIYIIYVYIRNLRTDGFLVAGVFEIIINHNTVVYVT